MTIVYLGLGVTTILVLRIMSSRFRLGDASGEAGVPYGPGDEPARSPEEVAR